VAEDVGAFLVECDQVLADWGAGRGQAVKTAQSVGSDLSAELDP
jgi:hypothetical protein